MQLLTPRTVTIQSFRLLQSLLQPNEKRDDTVLVHGGAGDFSDEDAEKKALGVQTAANEAYLVLKETNNVLDAVEYAIKLMERNEIFNAGYGSHLSLKGEVEMDASIMLGTELQGAGVATVSNIKHPITLARMVMMKTNHSLLVGEGAMKFAKENGMIIVSPDILISKRAKELWEKVKIVNHAECGTVGCVAMDKAGNLAAGTSTGGINRRTPGRFTATSGLGAGTYADNGSAGVSCSGHSDSISKLCLAYSIANRMNSLPPMEAVQSRLAYMKQRLKTNGGAIAISKAGRVGIGFTTKKMPWACRKGRMLYHGIKQEEPDENEP